MPSPPSTSPTSWLRRHLHQHPATVGMFSGIHKPSLDIRYVTISDGLSSSPTSAIDVEIKKILGCVFSDAQIPNHRNRKQNCNVQHLSCCSLRYFFPGSISCFISFNNRHKKHLNHSNGPFYHHNPAQTALSSHAALLRNPSAINSDYGDGLDFFLASFSNPSDTSMTFGGRLGLMNETPLLTAVVDPFIVVVFGTYSYGDR
nr:seed lectin-like [Ipomoea trifida]